jgi:hypothetical protein
MKSHIEKVVSKVLDVIILVAIFFVFIYNYQMSAVKTVKQLMVEEYGFSEDEVSTLF